MSSLVILNHAVSTKRLLLSVLLLASLLAVPVVSGLSTSIAKVSEAVQLYNQGIDAFHQGNVNKAMAMFERAIMIDATYTDAYYNLGSIYYQKAMYAKAEAAFRRAASLAPKDEQAKYNLALSLEKLNRPADAIRVLQDIPVGGKNDAQSRRKIEQLQGVLAQQQPAPAKPTSNTPIATIDYSKVSVKPFSKGFFGPTGITLGPEGYLYVANYSKNLVYKVSATGDKTVFAKSDLLGGPIGLVFNPKNQDMYVANYLKNTVTRINPKGEVSVIASGLSKPYNLFLDTYNNILFIGEQETNAITKIELSN